MYQLKAVLPGAQACRLSYVSPPIAENYPLMVLGIETIY